MKKGSLDRQRKKSIAKWLIWFVLMVIVLYIGYDTSISNVGFSPDQPIAFSHKVHSGDFGMKCLYCHTTAESSSFSEIPTAHSCMICHIALKEASPLIEPLSTAYFDEIPIKWNSVYRLPDYVHFDHSRHILASIDCSSCHGEVETMDSIYQHTKLTMKWCIDCHREPEKYVIPAREISGIYLMYNDSLFFNLFSESVVEPAYGEFISELPEQFFDWFVYPKKPGRGPEHCSACHH
jgi:hypothetical protein